jgi:hypothetical protein
MSNVTPSENFIQQESIQFNQPVSEAAGSAIGALANFLRETILPVGSVVYSTLTEAQFQLQNKDPVPSPERWVLADGRNVSGSKYESVTGNSAIPDLRGVFLRGKNNGRSGTTGNPDGDSAIGTYQSDQFGSHNHSFSDPGHSHQFSQGGFGSDNQPTTPAYGSNNVGTIGNRSVTSSTTGITFVASGGNETRPRNVTLNAFIRIN